MPTVNILLVDDDEVDVEAVQRGFRKMNISNPIHVADDGFEALEMLRGQDKKERLPRPYIILLDLNMPRMTGLELLEEIRKDPMLTKSIVFILTTSEDDKDKCMAYENHVAGYLLKSRVGKDFMDLVHMLDRFMVTIEYPPE
jgi:CheY-like chemotaxis protein